MVAEKLNLDAAEVVSTSTRVDVHLGPKHNMLSQCSEVHFRTDIRSVWTADRWVSEPFGPILLMFGLVWTD